MFISTLVIGSILSKNVSDIASLQSLRLEVTNETSNLVNVENFLTTLNVSQGVLTIQFHEFESAQQPINAGVQSQLTSMNTSVQSLLSFENSFHGFQGNLIAGLQQGLNQLNTTVGLILIQLGNQTIEVNLTALTAEVAAFILDLNGIDITFQSNATLFRLGLEEVGSQIVAVNKSVLLQEGRIDLLNTTVGLILLQLGNQTIEVNLTALVTQVNALDKTEIVQEARLDSLNASLLAFTANTTQQLNLAFSLINQLSEKVVNLTTDISVLNQKVTNLTNINSLLGEQVANLTHDDILAQRPSFLADFDKVKAIAYCDSVYQDLYVPGVHEHSGRPTPYLFLPLNETAFALMTNLVPLSLTVPTLTNTLASVYQSSFQSASSDVVGVIQTLVNSSGAVDGDMFVHLTFQIPYPPLNPALSVSIPSFTLVVVGDPSQYNWATFSGYTSIQPVVSCPTSNGFDLQLQDPQGFFPFITTFFNQSVTMMFSIGYQASSPGVSFTVDDPSSMFFTVQPGSVITNFNVAGSWNVGNDSTIGAMTRLGHLTYDMSLFGINSFTIQLQDPFSVCDSAFITCFDLFPTSDFFPIQVENGSLSSGFDVYLGDPTQVLGDFLVSVYGPNTPVVLYVSIVVTLSATPVFPVLELEPIFTLVSGTPYLPTLSLSPTSVDAIGNLTFTLPGALMSNQPLIWLNFSLPYKFAPVQVTLTLLSLRNSTGGNYAFSGVGVVATNINTTGFQITFVDPQFLLRQPVDASQNFTFVVHYVVPREPNSIEFRLDELNTTSSFAFAVANIPPIKIDLYEAYVHSLSTARPTAHIVTPVNQTLYISMPRYTTFSLARPQLNDTATGFHSILATLDSGDFTGILRTAIVPSQVGSSTLFVNVTYEPLSTFINQPPTITLTLINLTSPGYPVQANFLGCCGVGLANTVTLTVINLDANMFQVQLNDPNGLFADIANTLGGSFPLALYFSYAVTPPTTQFNGFVLSLPSTITIVGSDLQGVMTIYSEPPAPFVNAIGAPFENMQFGIPFASPPTDIQITFLSINLHDHSGDNDVLSAWISNGVTISAVNVTTSSLSFQCNDPNSYLVGYGPHAAYVSIVAMYQLINPPPQINQTTTYQTNVLIPVTTLTFVPNALVTVLPGSTDLNGTIVISNYPSPISDTVALCDVIFAAPYFTNVPASVRLYILVLNNGTQLDALSLSVALNVTNTSSVNPFPTLDIYTTNLTGEGFTVNLRDTLHTLSQNSGELFNLTFFYQVVPVPSTGLEDRVGALEGFVETPSMAQFYNPYLHCQPDSIPTGKSLANDVRVEILPGATDCFGNVSLEIDLVYIQNLSLVFEIDFSIPWVSLHNVSLSMISIFDPNANANITSAWITTIRFLPVMNATTDYLYFRAAIDNSDGVFLSNFRNVYGSNALVQIVVAYAVLNLPLPSIDTLNTRLGVVETIVNSPSIYDFLYLPFAHNFSVPTVTTVSPVNRTELFPFLANVPSTDSIPTEIDLLPSVYTSAFIQPGSSDITGTIMTTLPSPGSAVNGDIFLQVLFGHPFFEVPIISIFSELLCFTPDNEGCIPYCGFQGCISNGNLLFYYDNPTQAGAELVPGSATQNGFQLRIFDADGTFHRLGNNNYPGVAMALTFQYLTTLPPSITYIAPATVGSIVFSGADTSASGSADTTLLPLSSGSENLATITFGLAFLVPPVDPLFAFQHVYVYVNGNLNPPVDVLDGSYGPFTPTLVDLSLTTTGFILELNDPDGFFNSLYGTYGDVNVEINFSYTITGYVQMNPIDYNVTLYDMQQEILPATASLAFGSNDITGVVTLVLPGPVLTGATLCNLTFGRPYYIAPLSVSLVLVEFFNSTFTNLGNNMTVVPSHLTTTGFSVQLLDPSHRLDSISAHNDIFTISFLYSVPIEPYSIEFQLSILPNLTAVVLNPILVETLFDPVFHAQITGPTYTSGGGSTLTFTEPSYDSYGAAGILITAFDSLYLANHEQLGFLVFGRPYAKPPFFINVTTLSLIDNFGNDLFILWGYTRFTPTDLTLQVGEITTTGFELKLSDEKNLLSALQIPFRSPFTIFFTYHVQNDPATLDNRVATLETYVENFSFLSSITPYLHANVTKPICSTPDPLYFEYCGPDPANTDYEGFFTLETPQHHTITIPTSETVPLGTLLTTIQFGIPFLASPSNVNISYTIVAPASPSPVVGTDQFFTSTAVIVATNVTPLGFVLNVTESDLVIPGSSQSLLTLATLVVSYVVTE